MNLSSCKKNESRNLNGKLTDAESLVKNSSVKRLEHYCNERMKDFCKTKGSDKKFLMMSLSKKMQNSGRPLSSENKLVNVFQTFMNGALNHVLTTIFKL